MDEDAILDALHDVRATIAEWQAEGVFDGDQGYQRLLTRESELEAQLEALYDN